MIIAARFILITSVLLALTSCSSGGGNGTDSPVAACSDNCHAVPPSTGAHLVHFGEQLSTPRVTYGDLRITQDFEPLGSDVYLFGCGNCHPADTVLHNDSTTQVELYSATTPGDSLKARNPVGATFDGTGCSNVYCHSTGQQNPTYVDTPAWASGNTPLPRCGACHDNPPAYTSGGAGTETANSHLQLADDGAEFGHFAGLPGAWHNSYHGSATEQAAPITCQTCHFESVNETNTGPGGFYYLDTNGNYDLGGSLAYACSNCHDGQPGSPANGTGMASPRRHVNGQRDVNFDSRTSIPDSVSGIPASPNRPTYPYWVTAISSPLPPNSTTNGITWSLHLAGSSYDPVLKTCSNVACHLKQSFGTGSPLYEPLTWGLSPVGYASCSNCHQY